MTEEGGSGREREDKQSSGENIKHVAIAELSRLDNLWL